MSQTFRLILELVTRQELRISDHGYDELSEDAILISDMLAGIVESTVIEDYPDYLKGPCVLVLQRDRAGGPIHVVWGIPRNMESPAVLVPAYRPEPQRWYEGFTRRRQ